VSDHPLTDAWIADNYPEAEPETIRRQFDALMKQIELSSWKPFPRFPEVMARVVTEKARTLPDRVNGLLAALAGLPEHWRQWQWGADTKQSFGSKYVRVLGDSGMGMGVQYIADTPGGDPQYFGKLAEFIAAANPDTIGMLLAERAEMLKAAEPKAPLPRLSTKARARINETIEIDREMGDRQIASDIEFLLEVHDRVHGITAS
jgi:hypothetical protein